MADIRFKDGQILFSGGRIAMSDTCCCSETVPATCGLGEILCQPRELGVDISGLGSYTAKEYLGRECDLWLYYDYDFNYSVLNGSYVADSGGWIGLGEYGNLGDPGVYLGTLETGARPIYYRWGIADTICNYQAWVYGITVPPPVCLSWEPCESGTWAVGLDYFDGAAIDLHVWIHSNDLYCYDTIWPWRTNFLYAPPEDLPVYSCVNKFCDTILSVTQPGDNIFRYYDILCNPHDVVVGSNITLTVVPRLI